MRYKITALVEGDPGKMLAPRAPPAPQDFERPKGSLIINACVFGHVLAPDILEIDLALAMVDVGSLLFPLKPNVK